MVSPLIIEFNILVNPEVCLFKKLERVTTEYVPLDYTVEGLNKGIVIW